MKSIKTEYPKKLNLFFALFIDCVFWKKLVFYIGFYSFSSLFTVFLIIFVCVAKFEWSQEVILDAKL